MGSTIPKKSCNKEKIKQNCEKEGRKDDIMKTIKTQKRVRKFISQTPL